MVFGVSAANAPEASSKIARDALRTRRQRDELIISSKLDVKLGEKLLAGHEEPLEAIRHALTKSFGSIAHSRPIKQSNV